MKSRLNTERKIGTFTTLCSVLAISPALTIAQEKNEESQKRILEPIDIQAKMQSMKVDYSSSAKFTAPLLDTPKSVTVIPEVVIEDTASNTLEEALRTTPGITFGAGEGGNPLGDRPFIRGFDSQGSIFSDGIRDIGASTHELFNIESIEVIKGSDSVYSGRGGAGGSINMISKMPHLGNAASAEVSLGTPSYGRLTADGNWQFGKHSAFRLNLMTHKNDVAGRDQVYLSRWGIAPSISLGLGTRLRFNASFYHLDSHDLPDGGIPYLYNDQNKPKDVSTITPAAVNPSNFYGLVHRDFRDTKVDMGTVTIEYDLVPTKATIKNTTRYTKSSQNYLWSQAQNNDLDPQKRRNTRTDFNDSYFANDLFSRRVIGRDSSVWNIVNLTEVTGKVETGPLKHDYLIGYEYSNAWAKRRGLSNIPDNCAIGENNDRCGSLMNPDPYPTWRTPLPLGPATNSSQTTNAFYLFNTVELTPQWLVNLGFRVDDYNTSVLVSRNLEVSRHDTLLNWQAGLVFKPIQNLSIYASFATSSTPGGYLMGEGFEGDAAITPNNRGVIRNNLSPEKHKSYEVGGKWDVLDNRLSLTAAIFQIDTDNARISLSDGDFAMAGNRKIRGFELGSSGYITNRWEIFGGYTYLDSQNQDNDKQFPQTPKNSLSLWSNYHFTPRFTLGGGAFYVAKVYGDVANTRAVPDYWRFDAMAQYQINKNMSLQVNAQNIFDKHYFSTAHRRHYAIPGVGRTLLASFKIQTK